MRCVKKLDYNWETLMIETSDQLKWRKGCLRSHLSQHEQRFVENYFTLDRDNVIFLSARKLLQHSGLIQNLFRHVVQKGFLDQINPLDDYMRFLNLAMVDSGIFICRVSAQAISDWTSIARCSASHAALGMGRRNNNRYSLAEWLGRLVFFGFDIIEYHPDMTQVTIAVMKTGEPKEEVLPVRGWLFRMPRIGYKGEMINVYKIRTMYPFSQFLQDYIVRLNGYNSVGKPERDFRITPMGRLLRKYWLDELPQIINVLRGEMNLVGVRPLSQARFNELPESLREQRIMFKPGCIPPYVALCMPDAKSNIVAEQIYFERKKNHPIRTDLLFFFKALFNIFSGRIASS